MALFHFLQSYSSCKKKQIFIFLKIVMPLLLKQRRNELRKRTFFVSLPLRCRLLILVDSYAEWGWPDTLGTIQGAFQTKNKISLKTKVLLLKKNENEICFQLQKLLFPQCHWSLTKFSSFHRFVWLTVQVSIIVNFMAAGPPGEVVLIKSKNTFFKYYNYIYNYYNNQKKILSSR